MFRDDSSSHGRSCKPCTTYSVTLSSSSSLQCPSVVQNPQQAIAATLPRLLFQSGPCSLDLVVTLVCHCSHLTPIVIHNFRIPSLPRSLQSIALCGRPELGFSQQSSNPRALHSPSPHNYGQSSDTQTLCWTRREMQTTRPTRC